MDSILSDDERDVPQALTRAAQKASIHLARAAKELWRGAAVFVEEITEAFDDDDDDDDEDRPQRVPIEDE